MTSWSRRGANWFCRGAAAAPDFLLVVVTVGRLDKRDEPPLGVDRAGRPGKPGGDDPGGEVATKAGLGRATVSTTLSKLSKSRYVQKGERGYRLCAPSSQAHGTDSGADWR